MIYVSVPPLLPSFSSGGAINRGLPSYEPGSAQGFFLKGEFFLKMLLFGCLVLCLWDFCIICQNTVGTLLSLFPDWSLLLSCCKQPEEAACWDSLMEGSSAGFAVKFSPWFCAADTGVQCEPEWAERSPGALQYSPVQWRRCDCQSEPLVVC